MIYRIKIDMMFETNDPVDDISDKCRDFESLALTINQGQPNEYHSSITTQQCFHNTDPLAHCIIVYHWISP